MNDYVLDNLKGERINRIYEFPKKAKTNSRKRTKGRKIQRISLMGNKYRYIRHLRFDQ